MTEICKVGKKYGNGPNSTAALSDITVTIADGEFVLIVGDSGSGKTTLLNLIGGIDRADEGNILVDGTDITQLSSKQLTEYRARKVGFVFQTYNLIRNLSCRENVELIKDISKDTMETSDVFALVNLEDKLDAFPNQISGGQSQRVAIARAIYKKPQMLLCDEPTGALDYENSRHIMSLLQQLNKSRHMTVIIVTHNLAFCPIADKIIRLKSGKIAAVELNSKPVDANQLEW